VTDKFIYSIYINTFLHKLYDCVYFDRKHLTVVFSPEVTGNKQVQVGDQEGMDVKEKLESREGEEEEEWEEVSSGGELGHMLL
jgi:hypothetical protein